LIVPHDSSPATLMLLSLSGDARDTVHGFVFGVAFGLLLLWIYVRARSRR